MAGERVKIHFLHSLLQAEERNFSPRIHGPCGPPFRPSLYNKHGSHTSCCPGDADHAFGEVDRRRAETPGRQDHRQPAEDALPADERELRHVRGVVGLKWS